MSNKHYRTAARGNAGGTAGGAGAHPASSIINAAERALDPADAALLDSVKEFLGKLVRRAAQMMDELPPLPGEFTQHWAARKELREHVSRVARVGIAACRALMSAMRLSGADTAKVRKLIDETANRLQQRMEQLPPAA